jgi:SAM-dependent methyltransferase
VLRAFRWRGVQENLDLILDVLTDPGNTTLDLGGAASPFGLGSVVVDQLPYDKDGNVVPYRSLADLEGPVDAILSSHTLEHIPDLQDELGRIYDSLRPGGRLIALVPAFTCVRWRAGVHSHATFGDHVWTFGLSGTPNLPEGLHKYVAIDEMMSHWFELEQANYCGDDSIFLVARRQ